ncbi:MAG: GNAT family N-acetyltransferase [Actinomycetes bacterium]
MLEPRDLTDLTPDHPLLAEVARVNRAAVPAVNDLSVDELAHLVGMSRLARAIVAVDAPDPTVAALVLALPSGCGYRSENYAWFERAETQPYLYVDRVVVADAHRRLGLGARLYDEVVAAARASGAAAVCAEVNVRPRNEASLRFHEARGFVPVGEQDTGGGEKRVRLLRLGLPG